MEDTTLVFESPETIKAVEIKNGKAIVGAYAIRFSTEIQKDLQGEFFTANTYLGAHKGDGVDVLFNHGQAPTKAFVEVCNLVLAAAKATTDAVGVFVQHVLDLSNEYEAAIAQLCAAGKLKWSSGATSHMVQRGENGEIKRWPIAEFSYTPTPAEPRLPAITPLKSLAFSDRETAELGAAFDKSQSAKDPKHIEAAPIPPPPPPQSVVDKKTLSDPPTMDNADPDIQKEIDARVKAEIEKYQLEQEKIREAVKARTREVEEMYATGDKFGRREEAARFVAENKSLAEFHKFILDRFSAKGFQPLSLFNEPDTKIMTRKDFDALTVGKRMEFLKSGGKLME